MTNNTKVSNGIFIPSEIATDQSLNWNEKAVYSFYHNYTFYGKLQCSKLTNESVAQLLGIGGVRTLRRIKSELSQKGLISICGNKVTALKKYAAKTAMTLTGDEDNPDQTERTTVVSKEDINIPSAEDKNDLHNKKVNKKIKDTLREGEDTNCVEIFSRYLESESGNSTPTNPPIAPLHNSNIEDYTDNSVVNPTRSPKYTNRKTFWEAWHSFKDGCNTDDTLQELITNARFLGIKDDLASEYEQKKEATNTSKSTDNIPWVRMMDDTDYDLTLPPSFKIPYEWKPQYKDIPDKAQIIIYIQNASELLRNSEIICPQYTLTYFKAYLLELRTIVAYWFPNEDKNKREFLALWNWNKWVGKKYKIKVLCGVAPLSN